MNADAPMETGPWFAAVVGEDGSREVTTVAFVARQGAQLPTL